LGIIVALLLFNAGVGFWQEYQAGNAVAALKKKLALKSRVLREGAWQLLNAQRAGSRRHHPPAGRRYHSGRCQTFDGDYLSVDQSALTGESLPVGKEKDDVVYSGSIAKQGEMIALVTTTGAQTYFGRTARLVAGAGKASHFQKAVLQIGDYLIYLSLGLVVVLVLVQLFRGSFTELLQFALILTVASIPVAMPAVLSVTMAVGAVALSKMKAIVSRLESVEEMAVWISSVRTKPAPSPRIKLTLGDPQTLRGVRRPATDPDRRPGLQGRKQRQHRLAVINGLDDPKCAGQLKRWPLFPSIRWANAPKRRSGTTAATVQGDQRVHPRSSWNWPGSIERSRKKAEQIVDAIGRQRPAHTGGGPHPRRTVLAIYGNPAAVRSAARGFRRNHRPGQGARHPGQDGDRRQPGDCQRDCRQAGSGKNHS
jgi:hypothetical protein